MVNNIDKTMFVDRNSVLDKIFFIFGLRNHGYNGHFNYISMYCHFSNTCIRNNVLNNKKKFHSFFKNVLVDYTSLEFT